MRSSGRSLSAVKAILLVVVLWTILSGCARIPVRRSSSWDGQTLYLALIWHQHQPLYFQDPDSGVYTRPWVRAHATKDYYDMAAMLEGFPDLKVTFNLTPVLIRQLEDFAAGAKDRYWVLSEKPAESLSREDKVFILRRFFDANYTRMIGRFPRYRELLDKRGGGGEVQIEAALESFTTEDFRDLQVWFNLAWFDPDFLEQEPLRELVGKGRSYSEADKRMIFDQTLKIIRAVVPKHRELQERGQIEVITTPYAHPILPLIYNSDLAEKSDPGAELPERFSYPQDVIAHLAKSVEIYRQHYGRDPVGLWPAEGAVGQEIVKLVSDAGYRWMASGEQVLARSLAMDSFTRDSRELVEQADALYRPYYVRYGEEPEVGVIFRDVRLSDLIGFEYSGTPAEEAAQDFIGRLERIRSSLYEQGDGSRRGPKQTGPHLVTVILDGENAWEHYPNDGKAFLHALYSKLSESRTIRTVTPAQYLERFPEQRRLEQLWRGSWFSPDYATWIGEREENIAWDYLGKVRRDLGQYDFYKRKQTDPDKLERALDAMYLAEGSDWFWWYGTDQDSGVDEYFDRAFRALLGEVYRALEEEQPDFLRVPIIAPDPVPALKNLGNAFTPTIDGAATPGEWDQGACHLFAGGQFLESFYYGFDAGNLYLRLDAPAERFGVVDAVELYLQLSAQQSGEAFSRSRSLLGIRAGSMLRLSADGAELWRLGRYGQWQMIRELEGFAVQGGTVELSLPLELIAELGRAEAGDRIRFQIAAVKEGRDQALLPQAGPVQATIPDLGDREFLLVVDDPGGDDHGPGSYIYPTDPVFESGVFDIERFTVAVDESNVIFTFKLVGAISNVWGSGLGFSLQTFDIYIDTDPGAATGARLLLEGRNASLPPDHGWEYALWVEGWQQKLLTPDQRGRPVEQSGNPLKVLVNPDKREITIRVLRSALSADTDPRSWSYLAAVLSQEGFPQPGVRRVRDVEPEAEQWRIGGGPADTNHSRIMDLAWPKGASPSQEEILQRYVSSQQSNLDMLSPDDFAIVPMIRVRGESGQ